MVDSFKNEKNAVLWLQDLLLPFLNSSGDQQIIETFINAYLYLQFNSLAAEEFDPALFKRILNSKDRHAQILFEIENLGNKIDVIDSFNHESSLNRIKDSKAFLVGMLTIALVNKEGKDIPENLKTRVPMIEERILNHYKNDWEVFWRGKGELFVVPKTKDVYGGKVAWAEGEIVFFITDYFFSCGIEDEKSRGNGFDKIGLCPNCGIFFAKKRKDQEGCSKQCSNNLRVKRFREKTICNA